MYRSALELAPSHEVVLRNYATFVREGGCGGAPTPNSARSVLPRNT
jgi:hypothetical protein